MNDLRTAAQQALEALGLWATGRDMDAVALNDLILRLEAALENQFNPDWDRTEALQESLREHMAEIHRLRAALAEPQIDPVDEYRKGFIAGQIDMRDREQAEPVQKPVAWRYKYSDGFWRFSNGSRVNGCDPIESQALYTAPPQRKPLTEGKPWVCACGANLYIDENGAPRSKA